MENYQCRVDLYNMNNLSFELADHLKADLIYADYIYEDLDFTWANRYWLMLRDGGVFIAQTDFHSDYRIRAWMEDELGATFVNDIKWKNEWGNHPKDRMHQCYDSILIFCKGEKQKWTFRPDVIQVPKATAKTNLNPSGRQTKTATAWIDDICLTTTSKERVKKSDGHLIRWQKPLKLYDRVIAPFSKDGDLIIDPFMGSGSLGKWCKRNNRSYIGIERDREVYKLARKNISNPS